MTRWTCSTWNLLHRVHAENWAEEVPGRHPDEAARIAAISEEVVALAARSVFVGLQEVSGDQLAHLRAALPRGAQLLSLRYPRVPRPRAGLPHRATLRDPSEHLVSVIAGGVEARLVEASAFDDDPGKGFVAAEVAGVLVINTHVTQGERRRGQLARLAARVRGHRGAALLVGDFNADRAVVGGELGLGCAFAEVAPGALPTRPRRVGGKSQAIDHVIVIGGGPGGAVVVDAGGLSDHNIVSAAIDVDEPMPLGFGPWP